VQQYLHNSGDPPSTGDHLLAKVGSIVDFFRVPHGYRLWVGPFPNLRRRRLQSSRTCTMKTIKLQKVRRNSGPFLPLAHCSSRRHDRHFPPRKGHQDDFFEELTAGPRSPPPSFFWHEAAGDKRWVGGGTVIGGEGGFLALRFPEGRIVNFDRHSPLPPSPAVFPGRDPFPEAPKKLDFAP